MGELARGLPVGVSALPRKMLTGVKIGHIEETAQSDPRTRMREDVGAMQSTRREGRKRLAEGQLDEPISIGSDAGLLGTAVFNSTHLVCLSAMTVGRPRHGLTFVTKIGEHA